MQNHQKLEPSFLNLNEEKKINSLPSKEMKPKQQEKTAKNQDNNQELAQFVL